MSEADKLLAHWRGLRNQAEELATETGAIEDAGRHVTDKQWDRLDNLKSSVAEASVHLIAHIESTGELPAGWGTKP